MRRVVPAFCSPLALERRLETTDVFRGAFVVAVEQLGAAAFLVSPQGRWLEGNAAGRAALAADPIQMRRALEGAARRGTSRMFDVIPIRVHSRGKPDALLLIRRDAANALDSWKERAAARWRLSRRQTEVLGLVAEGRSNRTIAAILDIGERTVETHLTAIYGRAQVEGRSELVASLWRI
jgi:DNA-binding CsgD family transcriptional regulator